MSTESSQSGKGLLSDDVRVGFHRGERWAFDAVAREHFAYIANFIAHLLSDRDRALDLAQEAFFLACRSHQRYDPSRKLAPWLFQIARNLAYKEMNKRSKQTIVSLDETIEETGNFPVSNMDSPTDESVKKETAQRLQRAIKRLKPEYQDVVILRIVQGLPSERVANMLDIPIATVNTRTHRALQSLRKFARHEGIREEEVFS